jgi:P4 family phage/plasmid primase-like protien
MPSKLELFLNGNPNGKTDAERAGRQVTEKGKDFTFWSFDDKTKWYVEPKDMDEFYRLYCAELRKCVPQYLTERSTPISYLRVDLDFKYDGREEEHKHTQEQVIAFMKAYMAEIKKYVQLQDTEEIYVLEKEYPTFDSIHKISSSGVHIQIPRIKVRAGIEQSVRRTLLRRMEDFFPNLGCTKAWDDIYDKSPSAHSGNWPLLGSKKTVEGALPYEIKYILDWDSETGDISVDTQIPTTITSELLKQFSVRSDKSEEAPLTEYGKANTRAPVEASARAVSRGRADTRGIPGSRGDSPGRYIEPLSANRIKYIDAHVKNLATFRHSGPHDEYVKVGQCLKNIHPYDLEDVWLNFMAKSEDEGRRDESKLLAKWNGFNERVDGERLGEGSLRFWSMTDNYDGYKKIEENNIDSLIDEAAQTATENDVAHVVHAIYREKFVCASVRNNDWYMWDNHIWKNSENGVDLLAELSQRVSKAFHKKELDKLKEIGEMDACSHKENDPGCDSCKAEKARKQYSTVRLRLKTTSFKENVMRECKILFRDTKFLQKLDENKHLIAFTNGVFDTLGSDEMDGNGNYIRPWFRPGKQEDYISFCTNMEYNESAIYSSHPCWAELNKFLNSILPNEIVRGYFMKSLALCLSGEYVQRFHIMTGSGSNGKSMLMNLMGTAMGDYCYKANIAMFTQKRGKAGAAAPEMVRMKGRRFVTMSEPDEGEPLSTGFLKEITGSEKVSCRDLYAGSKQMVEFDVMAKFFLSCNEKPPVKTVDGGTWRRIKVVDFPSKFVHEPKLPHELPIDETIMQKVVSPEWATCFMSYLIHLYRSGGGLRKLSPPPEVDVFTNEYKEESDVIARFMREYIQPLTDPAGSGEPTGDGPPEPTTTTKVNETFKEWKRVNEIWAGNPQDLKKRIEAQYGKYPRAGWTSFRFGQA